MFGGALCPSPMISHFSCPSRGGAETTRPACPAVAQGGGEGLLRPLEALEPCSPTLGHPWEEAPGG